MLTKEIEKKETTEDQTAEATNPEVKETENENSASDDESTESTEEQDVDETKDDESEGEESETSEQEKGDKRPKRNSFKKRLDRARRKAEDALREADYWKRKALESDQPKTKDQETTTPKGESKPKADDYDSQEDFIEALTDWKSNQAIKAYDEKRQQETESKSRQESAKKWQEGIEAIRDEHPDFDELVEDVEDLEVPNIVRDALIDAGPKVFYSIIKNPGEAARIAGLSPVAAIKEIGKIEAKLSNSSEKTITKTKTTKAPKPITTVKGGGGKAALDISDPNISQSDYEKLRRKQRIERAGHF